MSILEVHSALAAPHSATTDDRVGVLFLAGFLVLGGCLQFFAAILGLRRKGELQSTIGRQLSATFGKRGTIIFWFVLGTLLLGGGLALGLPHLLG